MEHLRAKFHDALGAETNLYVRDGQIFIRGRNWAPEEVIRAISLEKYEEIFTEWLDDRKQDLLGRADAFLDEHDQRARFQKLKGAFDRGAVSPFVGAGLSQPSGYDDWKGFLKRVQQRTSIPEDDFLQLLSNGNFEEAAQQLADALGPQFDECLANTYATDRSLAGPVQLLPLAFNTMVFTTNFDSVLKRCYENAGMPFSDTIFGLELEELRRYSGANEPILVKLHGKATTARSRVLTRQEYESTYTSETVIRDAIECICGRTLLFIGCSLTADRLLNELYRITEARGNANTTRHYAFLEVTDDAIEKRLRESTLASYNIYPIWYPRGEHDDSIEALLYKLTEDTEQ